MIPSSVLRSSGMRRKTEPSEEVRALADLAFRLHRGDASVFDVLKRFARSPSVYRDVQFTGTGPSGVRCGFVLGDDPVTEAVQLGFFFAGPFWPRVFPGLLREVNRRWKEASRKQREAGDRRR